MSAVGHPKASGPQQDNRGICHGEAAACRTWGLSDIAAVLHDVVSLWDHGCTGLPDISPSAWTRVHLHASVTSRENMLMPSEALSQL